jgi:DNA-binding transcriptional ArsR family regulator
MVHYLSHPLDQTFAALADPTRRAILTRLAETGAQSAGEIAEPFAMSLPAVLKHLDVLARSGLIHREKRGRTVHCRLEAAPMRAAMAWLEHYERFWSTRLNSLAKLVEEETP